MGTRTVVTSSPGSSPAARAAASISASSLCALSVTTVTAWMDSVSSSLSEDDDSGSPFSRCCCRFCCFLACFWACSCSLRYCSACSGGISGCIGLISCSFLGGGGGCGEGGLGGGRGGGLDATDMGGSGCCPLEEDVGGCGEGPWSWGGPW